MYTRDVQEIMNICHAKKSVLPVVTFHTNNNPSWSFHMPRPD